MGLAGPVLEGSVLVAAGGMMFRRVADAALTAYFHALGIPAAFDLAGT